MGRCSGLRRSAFNVGAARHTFAQANGHKGVNVKRVGGVASAAAACAMVLSGCGAGGVSTAEVCKTQVADWSHGVDSLLEWTPDMLSVEPGVFDDLASSQRDDTKKLRDSVDDSELQDALDQTQDSIASLSDAAHDGGLMTSGWLSAQAPVLDGQIAVLQRCVTIGKKK